MTDQPVVRQILIVEDERHIAQALQKALGLAGFECDLAQNGVECLEMYDQKKYDLILLDLIMPEVNGWQVLEKLQGKGQKILVTTNVNQDEDVERAKKLGAIGFLVKSNTQLSEVVDQVKAYVSDDILDTLT